MKPLTIFLTVAFILISVNWSSAEIYKYVDENGFTHYTDSPTSEVVAPDENLESVTIERTPPAPSPPSPRKAKPQEPANLDSITNLLNEINQFEEENPQEKLEPEVELYVTSWCRYCKSAKKYFRSRGIDVKVYDVEKDKAAAQRMRRLTNRPGVPFAVINGRHINGFSVKAYERALGAR